MKSKRKIENLDIFAFFITGIIILFWFRSKLMIATAEEGIPLYDASRTFDLFKYIWADVQMGRASPFLIPRITYMGFASLLQSLGFSSWLIQATIFYLLILTPLLTIPRLIKRFFPKISGSKKIIACLFYVFNLFTLSQVWMRFIYALIFVWSFLPLFLLIWIRWVDTYRVKYLLALIISSFIFSGAFGLTASIATLWIPAGIYSIYKFFDVKDKRIKILLSSLFGLTVWFVFNLWWIYPIYHLKNNNFSSMLSSVDNINSLLEVSKYFPSNEIFLLKQQYWFGPENQVFDFYKTQITYILSVIIFVITIFGIFCSRKSKNWKFLVLLFISSWFFVKGANFPFGETFYKLIFKNFAFTQLIRNPYEKLGSVWLLGYSIFFAAGVDGLSKYFKKKSIIFYCLIIIMCGYLVLPLISGEVFLSYRFNVPQYYKEASDFIEQNSQARVLHLPFLRFKTTKYSWGYKGADISDYLIENPGISGTLVFQHDYDFSDNFIKNMNNENFTNLLNLMNVDFVLLHNDFISENVHQEDSTQSRNFIERWKDTEFVREFNEIELYKLNYESNLGDVYISDDIVVLDRKEDIIGNIVSEKYKQGSVYTYDKDMVVADLKSPEYEFKKISAKKYLIKIKNAEGPYVLVLSSNYNSLWYARINSEIMDKHFQVNGYANAWVVDKRGSYEIELVFKSWPWE